MGYPQKSKNCKNWNKKCLVGYPQMLKSLEIKLSSGCGKINVAGYINRLG
jgi:hypothetical protein